MVFAMKREVSRLIKLYLSFHLNKVVVILLGLALIIWIGVLILEVGLPIDQEDYLKYSSSYHKNYYTQCIFFMQILNGVFVAFFVGTEMNTMAGFDPMFVSKVSRVKIVLAKIMSNFLLLIWLILFEVMTLYLVGILFYDHLEFKPMDLYLIGFVLLPSFELLLFGEVLAIVFNNYFIPILIFMIDLISKIAIQTTGNTKVISSYIPQIIVKNGQIDLLWNPVLFFGICLLLFLCNLLLFQKKDIST